MAEYDAEVQKNSPLCPSDAQWNFFLDFIEYDDEFCKNVYLKPGFRSRTTRKWEQAVILLNSKSDIDGGCKKNLAGWKSSWGGLKYRARRALKKRPLPKNINPLYERVVKLVGPGKEESQEGGSDDELGEEAAAEVTNEGAPTDKHAAPVSNMPSTSKGLLTMPFTEDGGNMPSTSKGLLTMPEDGGFIEATYLDTDIVSYVQDQMEPLWSIEDSSVSHKNNTSKLTPSKVKLEQEDDDLQLIYENIMTVNVDNNIKIKEEDSVSDTEPFTTKESLINASKLTPSKVKLEQEDDDLQMIYEKIMTVNVDNNIKIKEEDSETELLTIEDTPVNQKIKCVHTPPSIGPGAVAKKRLTFNEEGINTSESSSTSDAKDHIAALEENTFVMKELIKVLNMFKK